MCMSRKRSKREAGEVDTTQGQELLFEVPRPPTPEGADLPKVVRCSECDAVLRSDRSKAAGVSQRCAAMVGVVVLTSMRKAKDLKARAA